MQVYLGIRSALLHRRSLIAMPMEMALALFLLPLGAQGQASGSSVQVTLDSTSSAKTAVLLMGGCWEAQPIGGGWDPWNQGAKDCDPDGINCDQGWTWDYALSSPSSTLYSPTTPYFETAEIAIANAPAHSFCLPGEESVDLWIDDSAYVDNNGLLLVELRPADCNENGISDPEEIGSGASSDCNANWIPDDCDIAAGTSLDVDANGIPDECEPDCNGNLIPDAYDIAQGTSQDCNANLIPDECDLADGVSLDLDCNLVPDECQGALSLAASPCSLSLATGGTQTFTLNAGPQPLINFYLLMGSLSGTVPGVPVDGLVLPLNLDAFLLYTVENANTAVHQASFGSLLPDGTTAGSVAFNLPPALNPSLAGTTLHHAYVVFDLTSAPGNAFVSFVSNPVPVTLGL